MNPLVPSKELETTTVTLDEIIYHRRVRVLDRAGQTSITEACRTFGISRTTYYRWAGRAERYGVAALMPKGRRSPAMPNAVPPETVEIVLAGLRDERGSVTVKSGAHRGMSIHL